MIDGSVLQSVQRCFEKKSRVVVKMVVSKCIVYGNKIFGWKSFFSIILSFKIDSWVQERMFGKLGPIYITGLKFAILAAFNGVQKKIRNYSFLHQNIFIQLFQCKKKLIWEAYNV